MISDEKIKSILAAELSASEITSTGDKFQESLALYLGNPDGRETPGHSQVTSTDVADCIEWIMPQIMKSFTQNNEVVVFDPVFQGDEAQAELETQYVYEILMKQNDGFIVLHQFIKDALMMRNGILKVYYAQETKKKIKEFTAISEEQLQAVLAKDDVEVIEQSTYVDEKATQMKQEQIQGMLQQMVAQAQGGQMPQEQVQAQMQQLQQELEIPVMMYDVKLSSTRTKGKIYVDPVPPEEFRINTFHNSLCLDNARFTAHLVMKSQTDLINDGIPLEVVKNLTPGVDITEREYRFYEQHDDVDHTNIDVSEDDSQQLFEVAECYLQMDLEDTGISQLVKVTTVISGENPTDILSVEPIESMPWVTTTAFLMSHKFEGRSITDRLKQIQEQKTALWRNMMDNVYLQNNQRIAVVENQVNLDDLMTSRPGGIVRTKRIDAIMPMVTPQMGQDAYNMMEYLDRIRAGRAGVDPEGGATPANIGDRVGSEGVDRLMTAKEDLVGLIIRVIAETGIKPLCYKIRNLVVNHFDAVEEFRFKGSWHKVQPTYWVERPTCTVRVGTGTGDKSSQLMTVNAVLAVHEKLLAAGGSVLSNEAKVFETLDDMCKFGGLTGASKYFTDPSSPEGKQARQAMDEQSKQAKQLEQQIQISTVQAQVQLAKAEQDKANFARENNHLRAKVDLAKNQVEILKQQSDSEIKMLKQQLDEVKAIAEGIVKDQELALQREQMENTTALELTRIEAEKQSQEEQNYQENKAAVNE